MPLRAYILNNFWWKLFALALATLIWLSVRLKIDRAILPPRNPLRAPTTRVFSQHRVRLMTDASPLGKLHLDPARVEVTVSGNASVLEKLAAEDIQVFASFADVPNVVESTHKVQVFTPAGVTVEKVLPPNVRIFPEQP